MNASCMNASYSQIRETVLHDEGVIDQLASRLARYTGRTVPQEIDDARKLVANPEKGDPE